jgi:hypothetical protein
MTHLAESSDVIYLPDDSALLTAKALADTFGWRGAGTVHNKRHRGDTLPPTVKVGRTVYFTKVRSWALSQTEDTRRARCIVCGKAFGTERARNIHRTRIHGAAA